MSETYNGGIVITYPSAGQTNTAAILRALFRKFADHNHDGAGNGVKLSINSNQDNSVDDRHVRLRNNEWFRGRNAANSADVNVLKVTTGNEVDASSATWNFAGVNTGALHATSFSFDALDANVIDDRGLRLRNGFALRGRNNTDTADVSILSVDSTNKISAAGQDWTFANIVATRVDATTGNIATITGNTSTIATMNGTTATIGTVNATTLNATTIPTVNATTVTAGSLGCGTGSFSGAVTAASLAASGALTSASLGTGTGSFSGAVTAASLTTSGALTSASLGTGTGSFSGAVTAGSFNTAGAIAAGSLGCGTGTFSGQVTVSNLNSGANVIAVQNLHAAGLILSGGTWTPTVIVDGGTKTVEAGTCQYFRLSSQLYLISIYVQWHASNPGPYTATVSLPSLGSCSFGPVTALAVGVGVGYEIPTNAFVDGSQNRVTMTISNALLFATDTEYYITAIVRYT